ncbi:MAG: chalcone isomerase family protein [Dechloromonas sp.]|nr:chalcone isomerase family protein [Dechloromonas sp.]
MSSISNSLITRRRLLLALVASPLASLATAGPETPTAGFRRWGSGEFRRFGFLVYEATLWAGGEDPLRPPLALKLTYKRNISGRDIADASVKEIRNLGVADEARLRGWGEEMVRIFPDVRPGDHILGVQLPDAARFFFNDRSIGTIEDPAFARAFFAIWLDARTSAPDLRAALLKRQDA